VGKVEKPTDQLKASGLSGMNELENISGIHKQFLYDWFKTRKWLFDACVEKAVREKLDNSFVSTELLKSHLDKINELLNLNIESLPASACLNRADFKCSSVEYYADCWGETGLKAIFNECSPNNSVAQEWIGGLLKANGFENFTVELEW